MHKLYRKWILADNEFLVKSHLIWVLYKSDAGAPIHCLEVSRLGRLVEGVAHGQCWAETKPPTTNIGLLICVTTIILTYWSNSKKTIFCRLRLFIPAYYSVTKWNIRKSLIELIIRQNEQLQDLWQQHESIKQQNESLRKQVEELEKAFTMPVVPFHIEDKNRKSHKKCSGAPAVHQGQYRKVSGLIDEHMQFSLPACSHCQGPESEVEPLGQVVEELVVRPWRVSLTTDSGYSRLPLSIGGLVDL